MPAAFACCALLLFQGNLAWSFENAFHSFEKVSYTSKAKAKPAARPAVKTKVKPAVKPAARPAVVLAAETEGKLLQPMSEPQVADADTCFDSDCQTTGVTCCETDCCDNSCCESCMIGPGGQYWFRVDYLNWWTRGQRVPPLLTTTGREVIVGGERSDLGARSNFRLLTGFWLDDCRTWGLQAEFLTLGEGVDSTYNASTGHPNLARPFINAKTGEPTEEQVADDDISGSFDTRLTEYFHSVGVEMTFNLACCECVPQWGCSCGDEDCCGCGAGYRSRAEVYGHRFRNRFRPDRYRVDLVGGWRMYRLNERLNMHEDLLVKNPIGPIAPGTTFDITDAFRTVNEFQGFELGVVSQSYWGCWSLELSYRLGLGNMNQVCTVDGETIVTVPGDPDIDVREQGLLTQPSNIGRYSRDRFSAIPQLAAELGYQWNQHVRFTFGYRVIFWDSVLRPAEQIDLEVNPDWLDAPMPENVSPARPRYMFVSSDYWAQGINAGMEIRF